MFRHPNYYKKLRKRNKTGVTATTKRNIGHSQELSFGFSPPVKSDQVISSCSNSTELAQRAPDPSHKRQAIEESVPHNDIEEAQASSAKPQASSAKLLKKRATSLKRQA